MRADAEMVAQKVWMIGETAFSKFYWACPGGFGQQAHVVQVQRIWRNEFWTPPYVRITTLSDCFDTDRTVPTANKRQLWRLLNPATSDRFLMVLQALPTVLK